MKRFDAIALTVLVLAAASGSAQMPTPKVPTISAPKLPTAAPTPKPSIVGPANAPPQLTMRGEPAVKSFSPQGFSMQGSTILFIGDLVPNEFHAALGQPPVDLPIASHTKNTAGDVLIRVKVPDGLASSGAPLVVWYGVNGPKKTLASSYKILRRPRVASFRVTDGPYAQASSSHGKKTKFEVELSDFDSSAASSSYPMLWRQCGSDTTSTGRQPDSAPGGSPYRVRYEFGLTNAGQRCVMSVQPYGAFDDRLPAGEVQVPSLETYTISDTWDLLEHTTPSGKKLSASASKGVFPCQLASIGSAGTFSTGVVKEGDDLTFQLRNGALDEACVFTTTPALKVKDEWAVKSVDWDFTEDSLCAAVNKFGTQASSGSTVSFFWDESAVFAVKFEALCKPNGNDLPKNSHVFKARLSSVKVIGPAGKTWRDAFK